MRDKDGFIIYKEPITKDISDVIYSDLSNLANGIYFVVLETNGTLWDIKRILMTHQMVIR